MIIFSLLYGVISYAFSYYGEMITYLGMTAPMALFALITWLKNPYRGNRAEVAVNRIGKWELCGMYVLTAVVTVGFYFILDYFETANMIPSTLSVTTSFIAVYLTFRRSPYFALAYAANDVVLIVLWTLAADGSIIIRQKKASGSSPVFFRVYSAFGRFSYVSGPLIFLEHRRHH